MLAGGADVAGTADVFAGDVIAGLISIDHSGTLLFAAETVKAFRAWFRAIGAGPSFVASANAALSIARRIVVAAALFRTVVPVKSWRTLRLTVHACGKNENWVRSW